MQCPNCQHEVLPGELFCDNCGRDLSDLQPALTSNPPDQTNLPPPPDPPVDPEVTVVSSGQSITPVETSLPAAGKPQLVIKEGGATYDLDGGREILVGRVDPIDGIYPDIDLTPHDPAVGVSRRHAILHEQGGQWFIRDNHSTNYTVVNRQRVNPDQDYLLGDGDEIRFGRVVASFHLGSAN